MENQIVDNNDVNNDADTDEIKINSSHLVDVSKTAIVEYLDIVKSEYENERSKKQSFENRSGLVMALLGAICIFLFEKVHLNKIISMMSVPLTFIDLIIIISGLTVYIGFAFTIVMVLRTISVKKHDNFEVRNINETLLVELRIGALCRLILTYKDIIIQHRDLNEIRAKAFKKSLYGISMTLISIVVYITITS